jgi:hypothetical protein
VTEQWKYQIRITLGDAVAEAARRDPGNSAIAPLAAILAKHHATLKCQFDAFADRITTPAGSPPFSATRPISSARRVNREISNMFC